MNARPAISTLTGPLARLEPLAAEHVDELLPFGLDPRIWEFMGTTVDRRELLADYVDAALSERERGEAAPYLVRDVRSGRAVGTTRFGAIVASHARAEIGWTWYDPAVWRSGINLDAKRSMLRHAFEEAGLRRVEFKTDEQNERSRRAIEGLGATFEGIFRKHMVRADGSARSSAYYSIVDEDWPRVRALLDGRIRS